MAKAGAYPRRSPCGPTLVHPAGAQLFALMSAALLPFRLIRHKRTFASTLRRTALSTFLVGPALGAGYAFVRLNSHSEEAIRESAARMRADKGERKREDYATIGGVLGAVSCAKLSYLCFSSAVLTRAPRTDI